MTVKRKKKRAYGGVSAEARDALRRERLIAAGLADFGTRGYAAATIESLCSAARVSTRDFYGCFATKEDLMLAVYDRIIGATMQSVDEAVAAAVAAGADARELIRAGLDAFAGSMAADERWARVNFIEVVGISQRVELRRREAIQGFGQLVRAASDLLAARGEVDRAALSPVVSIAMVGAVHETLTDWVIKRERPPLDEIVDELTDLFVASLLR